ncbi:hypothetical protein WA171_004241 [Blastocystis sp. BT1]
MKTFVALVAIVLMTCAYSEVTIVEYSPANGASINDIQSPIVLTFSDAVKTGNGSVVLRNGFNDTEVIEPTSSQFVLVNRTLTITSKDSFYYGSTYSVFFDGQPILDLNNVPVVLNEGTYSFSINKKDNGPMFIGIGIGMGLMLILIFVAYFILKCLVKRKEARENKLPEVIQEVKTETENKASIVC